MSWTDGWLEDDIEMNLAQCAGVEGALSGINNNNNMMGRPLSPSAAFEMVAETEAALAEGNLCI